MAVNSAAVARTVEALRLEGKLSDRDAALVQVVESLASAVDMEPGNASLWREFRAALDSLMRVGEVNDDNADEIGSIVAALRGAASLDDAKVSGSGDVGPGSRSDFRAARRSSDAVAARSRKPRPGAG